MSLCCLLAPAKYLKKKLGDRKEVSSFTLDEISEDMRLSPSLVRYQAENNGYHIAEAAGRQAGPRPPL
jgi:hypothetical protein